MAKDKFDRFLQSFREEMMTTGPNGFTNKANPKGPTAGYDPVMGMPIERRKKPIEVKGRNKFVNRAINDLRDKKRKS